ncbi:MAG: FAD-binding domain-containing protein, partial [Prochlorococcaceae cyanobacterium]
MGRFTVVLDLGGQLRLDDQIALHRAVLRAQAAPGGRLVVLHSRGSDEPLRGPHQRRLVEQALADLAGRLAAEGIPLLRPVGGDLEQALGVIARHGPVVAVERCGSNQLFADWPQPREAFPRVFSDFRRGLSMEPKAALPVPKWGGLGDPDLLRPDAWPGGWFPAKRPDQQLIQDPGADPRSAFPFRGDETSALARLEHYVNRSEGLRSYRDTRDAVLGSEGSSKFSPWLAIGALSVRRIWAEVRSYETRHGRDRGSEWMLQELLWREFFLWTQRCDPERFASLGGTQGRAFTYDEDQGRFARWTRADSGRPLIDAALNELNATGWLSNRVRQWVASDFVHRLRLPWLWGARWFA